MDIERLDLFSKKFSFSLKGNQVAKYYGYRGIVFMYKNE